MNRKYVDSSGCNILLSVCNETAIVESSPRARGKQFLYFWMEFNFATNVQVWLSIISLIYQHNYNDLSALELGHPDINRNNILLVANVILTI